MATSGTVATTVLDTSVVLDHAIRRCGLMSSSQTPETVEIARQNLYLILLNLANRGINLWCVENNLIPTEAGRATYPLEAGTVRLLNVMYSQPTRVTGTDTVDATGVTTDLSLPVRVVRWGVKLGAALTGAITLESSSDGVLFATVQAKPTATWAAGWYWFDIDPSSTMQYWRVSTDALAITVSEFYLASSVRDIPMTQFNRDEYTQQPDKHSTGAVATNYYYDKLIDPTISCWPVPDNEFCQLNVWRHRFVQDVGTLTDRLEVPQMWMEAVIWQLSARLAYELPNVDAARRTEIIQAAERFLMDAELGESDNAPIYWVPGIGVYTR